MILGTGCDLVEIERMKKACEKEAFYRVCIQKGAPAGRGKASVLAGDFAVKEAVAKVFGRASGTLCQGTSRSSGMSLESPM